MAPLNATTENEPAAGRASEAEAGTGRGQEKLMEMTI